MSWIDRFGPSNQAGARLRRATVQLSGTVAREATEAKQFSFRVLRSFEGNGSRDFRPTLRTNFA
ncbi:MAG: hypothetical protein HOI66_11905 [Verrucomicrobia bacterium]|nr:hypothetical protein [Verrucomicrobiota bacterium]